MAEDWKRRSDLMSWAISRIRRWEGSLRIRSLVDLERREREREEEKKRKRGT